MTRIRFIIACVCSILSVQTVSDVSIAESSLLSLDQQAPITLLLPADPTPLETYAASELEMHVNRVLDVNLVRIVEDTTLPAEVSSHPVIVLGRLANHSYLRQLRDDHEFEPTSDPQSYSLVVTAPVNNEHGSHWRAVLCGADPPGVLYAVRDFCHYHLYQDGERPQLQPAQLQLAPKVVVRYQSESGCNLFSADNDHADFMRKPSLNGYSRNVVFDKPYYLDWLSQWKVTHLNISWCNAPAYDAAWNSMVAYANSRGIGAWRHFVPYRPQHEYPPPHVSTEAPTSRNGDCPRRPTVRRWYRERLREFVTQEPLVAGIVIESPYHDDIYCHCATCQGPKNAYSESEMLDEFVNLARSLRPDLQVIRVVNNPIPDDATAERIAAELRATSPRVDFNINTCRDRDHRRRWHALGPTYGTYLRTFRSALRGKQFDTELDFLFNDFRLSAGSDVTVHGFCYRFYNARFGSFPTERDDDLRRQWPQSLGPFSLALVAEAAFEPFASTARRQHKIKRIQALTIPDLPPPDTDHPSPRSTDSSSADGSLSPAKTPTLLTAAAVAPDTQLFHYQYGLQDADNGYTIAGVCADLIGDPRREIVYGSRQSDRLHLIDAASGTTIWDRPMAGDHQSISAFDLDDDGQLEILYTTSNPGRLYVISGDGEILRQWDSDDWKLGNSPVVIDSDGDGSLEGFFGSRSKSLIRLRMSDLRVLGRRDGWVQCGCYTSALDVDDDGQWDLFAGSGDDGLAKGVLHRYDPASLQSRWSFKTNDNASSADPVLVDLNGDGRVEIIKSVDNYHRDEAFDSVAAYSHDGALLWKVDGLCGEDSPNVADLDGDGSVEIVGMTFGSEVYCLDQHGHTRWRIDLRPELDEDAKANLAPILCDLDGDRHLEILALTNGNYFDGERNPGPAAQGILFALSASGEIIDRWSSGADRHWNNAFACNIDDDPFLEIVLSGCGYVDVIETRGLGPNTEHDQRRRDYRRLNVLPWAYEDTFFNQRVRRENVSCRADSVVLKSVTPGDHLPRGRVLTPLLTLPDGFYFDRIDFDADIPESTGLKCNLVSAAGNCLAADVRPGQALDVRQAVRLEFELATTASERTPRLKEYSLTFSRLVGLEGDAPR